MEFLAGKLYPLKSIQTTLANVYAQLVEFCIRATRWYDHVRRSFVKKAIHSVLKTWPLEFEDIKLNIDMHIRRLREQSAVAHQAETREMHQKISDIRSWLGERCSCSIQMAFGEMAFPCVLL